jgi:hypothetical protein
MVVSPLSRTLKAGVKIQTPWSAHVLIKEVLLITQVDGHTFYGVLAETQDDESWDWLSNECLLWVFNDGTKIRIWPYSSQPSPFLLQEPESQLDNIIGHYELDNGQSFLAVKWKDSISPTWELEQDMCSCADAITDYFMHLEPEDHKVSVWE